MADIVIMHAPRASDSNSSSNITTLNHSPPREVFTDGMQLGTSIDAITGDSPATAIDRSTIKEEYTTSTGASENYVVEMIEDTRKLEQSKSLKFSSSITVPVDGLNVSSDRTMDFSSTATEEGCTLLYTINWERVGNLVRMAPGAKLTTEASDLAKKDTNKFRRIYGDYYVYQYNTGARFTAVWKCTASTTTALNDFKQEVSVNVNSEDVGGSAKMETAIHSSAKKHKVNIDVRISVVGNADNVKLDHNNITKTFEDFREHCKLIPTYAHFKHYSEMDHSIPNTIPIEPEVYIKVCNAFATAHMVLLMSSIAPGTQSARFARRSKLVEIINTIHAYRAQYESNVEKLTGPLKELEALQTKVMRLLDRQDLIFDVRSQTYDSIKKRFQIAYENDSGAWVPAAPNTREYSFGRVNFTPEDIERFAVRTVRAQDVTKDWSLFQKHSASVSFPGISNVHGRAVGIQVISHWTDGTNGHWCIPKQNPLGSREFKIDVISEGSRGMSWSLDVFYIDSKDYEQ